MLMKGSQIVMECLLEQGVDTVFGYPGGTILNIYDEFELHGYNQKIQPGPAAGAGGDHDRRGEFHPDLR